MVSKVRIIDAQVVTALCKECKCCLANAEHCYICHTKKAMETLCGCGSCPAKIEDYIERTEATKRRRLAIRSYQNAA